MVNMAKEELVFTHALGLSVSQNSLIAAVGNQSFLCNEKSSLKLPQESSHKMVHGFAQSPQCFATKLLLLYSENEFSLFKYAVDNKFELAYEGKTKDWINAAKFLNEKNCSQFVLHMAHSTLLRIQYDENKTLIDCSTLEVACCDDDSLLYCTNLQGDKYDDLNVISGNGFGEILFWQTHARTSISVDARVCPLLLRLKAHNGVIFSININVAAKLLVTSSDDRSLKFWKLKSTCTTVWKWDKVTVKPMFSCFGHTARVLCALVVRYEGHFFVISGGEDSNICIWSESGDLLFKRRQQFGTPVWRLDFDTTSSTIYTSGATGNILACNMPTVLRQIQPHFTNLISIDTSTEFIKKVKYLNSSTIIGLSNQNRLFFMKLKENKKGWKLISGLVAHNRSILEICNEIIAFCGYRRVTLLSYNYNSEHFKILFDNHMLYGHIQSFFFLSNTHFIVSDEFGNCLVLKGYNMEVAGRIKLNNFRNCGLTAALLVPPKYLLLSVRNGHIMLYKWDNSVDLSLKYTLKRLHGNMGATILQLLKVDNKHAYFLSAGHSPTIKFLHVSFLDNSLTTLRRECLPLAWIEASPTLDIFIGFNDNHLVVWSRHLDVILQLPCGGGHRCWDYQLENEEIHIMYVKQKSIFFQRGVIYNKNSRYLKNDFQNCWHSRNCNVIHLAEQQDQSYQYIVSAGDDNIIKIGKFIGSMFHKFAELHTHISSVRDLVLYFLKCENGNNIWLIFSVGGRAQLCINQLNSNGSSIKELFSNIVRTSSDRNTTFLDARLMAVNVLQHGQTSNFFIYVASADGNIRAFKWQHENPLQLLLVNTIDIRRCPLHIRVLKCHQLVLTTTTCGEIFGFSQSLDIKHFKFQLHIAGINAIDTLVKDKLLHLLTGGDNENVIHTIINLTDMTIIQKLKYSDLHYAQVNSLTLNQYESVRDGSKLFAYTCANDKQIYMIDLETQKYNRVAYTCISDVKGIVLDKDDRLYIYGCGLQRIKILTNN